MFGCPSSIYLFIYYLFILRERDFAETIQVLGLNFQILFEINLVIKAKNANIFRSIQLPVH